MKQLTINKTIQKRLFEPKKQSSANDLVNNSIKYTRKKASNKLKTSQTQQNIQVIDRNRLLGVDKIKIRIPFLQSRSKYIDNFELVAVQPISKDKKKYYEIMKFNKCIPYCNIFLQTCFRKDAITMMLKNTIYVVINIPKHKYGNNVFESTYGDLADVISFLSKTLLKYNIIAKKLKIDSTRVCYIEVGRNIIVLNAKEFIDLIKRNTRCWGRNEILITRYEKGTGYGCQIQNTNKQLSYYDKNLEILEHDPLNPILYLLDGKNIKIVRCEQKLNNTQEIRRAFKKDIYLSDLLYSDICSLTLYDVWEKQKLHTNIYDLSKVNVKDIFAYINSSGLGVKMKKGLVSLISDLNNNISFDKAYKKLQENFSVNYHKKVLSKYEEIINLFNVPTFSFIDTINENIYRNNTIQEKLK